MEAGLGEECGLKLNEETSVTCTGHRNQAGDITLIDENSKELEALILKIKEHSKKGTKTKYKEDQTNDNQGNSQP